MRYHSRLPLSPASPNYLVEFSSQRSNPTCSLSLANVSASVKASSESTSTGHGDMEIDTLNVLVSIPPIDNRCTIPFPKRAHSLLRSTAASLQTTLGNHSRSSGGQECEEETLAHDQDPPRKRTRTSAISTSTRTHSRRATSLPRHLTSVSVGQFVTAPLSPLPSPISSVSLTTHNNSPKDLELQSFPTSSASTPPLPISSSVPFPSSSLSPASSIKGASANLSARSPAYPTSRRKRATPGETTASLHLYRTLIYGLEVKYHHQQGNRGESSTNPHFEAVLKNTSCFDVQDALLAQRLRNLLFTNGVDMRLMIVDMVDISQEGLSDEEGLPPYNASMSMDVDCSDQLPVISPANKTVFHPHLYPSTTRSILSYQQLVATLLLRHQFQTSSRLRGKKRTGKRSSLAVE